MLDSRLYHLNSYLFRAISLEKLHGILFGGRKQSLNRITYLQYLKNGGILFKALGGGIRVLWTHF